MVESEAMTITISDELAAALKLRANQIQRRAKIKTSNLETYEDALQVVLQHDKTFNTLYENMGAAWPVKP